MSVIEQEREPIEVAFKPTPQGTRWRVEFVDDLQGTQVRKVHRGDVLIDQVVRIGSEPVHVPEVDKNRSNYLVKFVANTSEPTVVGLMEEVRKGGADDVELRYRQGAAAARLDVIDGMRIRMAQQEVSEEAWDSFGDMIAWAPLDSDSE